MGIDIYMNWDGMTEEDKQAQYQGFSIEHGHVGYLREAYFKSDHYVTKFLVKEAFESDDGSAEIPASILRQRLPMAIKLHMLREKIAYDLDVNEDDPSTKSFTDFVELAEKLESEGKTVKITASY